VNSNSRNSSGQAHEGRERRIVISEPRAPKLITLKELAERWNLPVSWLKDHVRTRCSDPLPIFRLGRYVRLDPDDPALLAWLARRKAVRR
jgi:hypothetical protein